MGKVSDIVTKHKNCQIGKVSDSVTKNNVIVWIDLLDLKFMHKSLHFALN